LFIFDHSYLVQNYDKEQNKDFVHLCLGSIKIYGRYQYCITNIYIPTNITYIYVLNP